MKRIDKGLIKRIEREMPDLDRTVARALSAWSKAPVSPDQDVYIDSTALHLQSFYSGLERIFEQTATQLDEQVPSGESWHYELLRQMGDEIPNKRPPLLSQQSLIGLNEFRKFRHVVRNVYATNLEPEKMTHLTRMLPEIWAQVRAELLAFADFLRLVEETE